MHCNRQLIYDKEHCWQHDIKRNTLQDDMDRVNGILDPNTLSMQDFKFSYVDKTDKAGCSEVKQFIERYEWLGKMPVWVTHRFIAREKSTGILACVVVMATPNRFSHLLGEEYRHREKLIARGASISWAPTNMASWMMKKSMSWMARSTEFRIFTAYSDPDARELGTVYQASNFYYLGQTFGGTKMYLDPNNKERGWFSSAGFADRSATLRYAKAAGIKWLPEWFTPKRKVMWRAIPGHLAKMIRAERDKHKATCIVRSVPSKHKYAYILGAQKAETKMLRKLFIERNGLKPYPKERGV